VRRRDVEPVVAVVLALPDLHRPVARLACSVVLRALRVDRLDELLDPVLLALVLAGDRALAVPAAGEPDGDPLEVVQLAVPPAAGDVQRLLREPGASAGEVSRSSPPSPMKCPPSPANRTPLSSSLKDQLPASSRPAFTR
jgi:hypothetical protein